LNSCWFSILLLFGQWLGVMCLYMLRFFREEGWRDTLWVRRVLRGRHGGAMRRGGGGTLFGGVLGRMCSRVAVLRGILRGAVLGRTLGGSVLGRMLLKGGGGGIGQWGGGAGGVSGGN